jgi:hypothetical protein
VSNCEASFRSAASQISDATERYDAYMTATVRGLLSGDLVRPLVNHRQQLVADDLCCRRAAPCASCQDCGRRRRTAGKKSCSIQYYSAWKPTASLAMNVASALAVFPRPDGAGPHRPTPVWQWPRARARCVPPNTIALARPSFATHLKAKAPAGRNGRR